jgi:tRNA (guanine37-N1)-methyltransferase
MVKVPALVVALEKGQTAMNTARNMHVIDHSLKIFATGDELWIPLTRSIDESESSRLSIVLGLIRIEERDFSERLQRPRTLTEVLQDRLPPQLLAVVPKSFDIMGHIAIVELPGELASFDELIGKAILETCPNVRTVMAKAGIFSSDYRTRELRLIAGVDNPVTCHKEHGCIFELDVRTVYFSPRLSHERLRIASQVEPGETVVDMFAGVGPYSILVAKKQSLSTVYAIDANPSAFKFLVSNVLANRVLKSVRPMMGDAREVVRSSLSKTADRVIMNLPGKALDFVDVACSSLKQGGGVIHFYSFESAENAREAASGKLKDRIESSGRELQSILAVRIVKEIAPYRVQVAVDARVT